MELQEITVIECCNRFSLSQTDLAKKLGLSIGLISKIKNGKTTLTQDTQRLFSEAFKGYKLIGGSEQWKPKYIALESEYKKLLTKYNDLLKQVETDKKENQKLKKKIKDLCDLIK